MPLDANCPRPDQVLDAKELLADDYFKEILQVSRQYFQLMNSR